MLKQELQPSLKLARLLLHKPTIQYFKNTICINFYPLNIFASGINSRFVILIQLFCTGLFFLSSVVVNYLIASDHSYWHTRVGTYSGKTTLSLLLPYSSSSSSFQLISPLLTCLPIKPARLQMRQILYNFQAHKIKHEITIAAVSIDAKFVRSFDPKQN